MRVKHENFWKKKSSRFGCRKEGKSLSFFNVFRKNGYRVDFLDDIVEKKAKHLELQELMIESAIEMIAKTIAKVDFQYYDGNQKVINEVYYTLNVVPNCNDTGTTFWMRVVRKLFRENECLIVILGKKLYLAKSFKAGEEVILDKTYSSVILEDFNGNEVLLNKTITSHDVIFLTLGNCKVHALMKTFYQSYAEMLRLASNAFKISNRIKYVFTMPQSNIELCDQDGNPVNMKDYVKNVLGHLESNDSVVVPLPSSMKLEEITSKSKSNSDDYLKLIRKYGDMVAMAFGIPLDVFYGSKTDKSTGTNDFITFAVLPILKIIEDGLNAHLISEEEYLSGQKIVANKFALQYFNIMDVASSIDKLRSVGYSFNDIQHNMGEPQIDEPWANRRYVTKNYMNVEHEEKGDKNE